MSSPSDQPGNSGGPPHAYPQVPPAPAAAAASVPQRLHPAVLGVWALSGVRALLVLVIAGSFNLYFALMFVLISVVGALARWWRFSWRLEGSALVIEQGVIQRQRRVIPLERIQSVESVRKLGHRVFGVVELRIESIGGGSTEGQLDALDPVVAQQLRSRLLRDDRKSTAGRGTGLGGGRAAGEVESASEDAPGTALTTQDDSEPPPLVRMRPGQLVVAGITGGRVGVFAAILGFASQVLGERVETVIDWVLGFVGGTEATSILTAALVLGAATFAIAFVLSVIATTLTFWDFRLTKDGANLYTTRGLLDQRSGTIPLHRVQSVRVEENLVRRWFGLAAVKVEVAGHAGGDSAQETSTVMPLGDRQEALRLAGTILDTTGVESVTLQRMPTGARDRRFVRAVVATGALTTPAVWWLGPEGFFALALLVPFAYLAHAAYRALGHAQPEGYVLARAGVTVRVTHLTRERSLQAVSVSSTPFQRRRGLATLSLHIARSPSGGGDPEVIDVDDRWAHEELVRLAGASDEAARTAALTAAGPIVRVATDEDAEAVNAVREAAFASPHGQRYGEQRVRDNGALEAEGSSDGHASGSDDDLSLVLEDDGEIVGHARLTRAWLRHGGKVMVLRSVAIRPDRQRQGLGTTLVKASLAAAAKRGAHRVAASGAPEFFEHLGFESGERHELSGPAEQGPWMVRLLPADDGSATGRLATSSHDALDSGHSEGRR